MDMDLHNYSSNTPSKRKKTLTCKSRVQCSVFGCHNRSEVGLYLLPKEDNLNLRKQWIRLLRMQKVAKNARVCGKHFKDEDFTTPSKIRYSSHYVYWPSRENIRDNMPNVFKKRFPNTRVILDCTEISVQKFTCLICKTRTYSQYKCSHTVKVLIGISPSRLITFVSKSFGGRTSDKHIFLYSKILEKYAQGDAVMVDKGFLVQTECTLAGIQLIQPPFLGKKKTLAAKECEENNDIAKARVHVERIMQRIKVFQILNSKISLTILESLDKIIKIICALVNLCELILKDRRFDSNIHCDDLAESEEELGEESM